MTAGYIRPVITLDMVDSSISVALDPDPDAAFIGGDELYIFEVIALSHIGKYINIYTMVKLLAITF